MSKGAKGETFIFKIKNQDPLSIGFGEVFYASLEIGNSGEAEQTLEVPYGTNYTVTEEAHLRYKVLGEGTHVVQTVEGFDSATIRNYKTSNEYFSDVSVKVNKVGDKGFPVDNSNPFNTEMPKALLPSDSTREDGNEEN